MRKREAGQAFILVLIVLAIGALLIVPAMRLTGTSLKSSEVIIQKVEALYAADGAQEYVLWKLRWDYYADNFTAADETDNFAVNVCGTLVNVTVVMRAVEGLGGITLATDDTIRPTKTVTPDVVSDGIARTYTYTISLEQLSDNNTQGLDAVYDILPSGFQPGTYYVPGSSRLRVDSGSWEQFGDPLIEDLGYGGQIRLRWPNPEIYPLSDNFTTDFVFKGIRDFTVRQVKELEFKVTGSLGDNAVHANWVVLKPWDTLSGPQAAIRVGTLPDPWYYADDGMFEVDKVPDPEVIPPGVEVDIKYTISVTNRDGATRQIQEITDYLPPGFTYSDNSTSGNITTSNPIKSLENINGMDRWKLLWTTDEFPQGNAVSIARGTTLNLILWARTTKDISGSYYNEVQALPDIPVPRIVYEIIGPTTAEDNPEDREAWNTNYSWNTGMVMVPAYDSRTDADGLIIDANMALILGGISITSWQIY